MHDLLTTAAAADRKGCTPMAIRNAIARGEINGQKLGPVWAVEDDAALAAYEVRETGGRAHRREEVASPEASGADVSADT